MMMRIMIVLAAIALAGCGDAQKDQADASTTTIDEPSDANVARADGDKGPGVSVGELPDFVELPRGARAITNMRMNDGTRAGGTLTLETATAPADLLAFYRASMARHGLKIGLENSADQMMQLMGESEDKAKTLMVTVLTDDEGVTTLNLVHSRTTS
ncbi:hypothetical protein [Sphingopyxis sp. C-1]|uniref:hypothetical protein n=1 Tax=Sphingopyxis sp. C-1 TaxID=262667 RepID=UPI0006C1AB83|nr:hypothetical protein [Sphingopyxis sp. C-1]GAO77519.1 hypothetical protein SC1_00810 [Sphingopyxis sp. C-1]